MKYKWHFAEERPFSDDLLAASGGHPLIARILAGRGMTDARQASAFLNPEAFEATGPEALAGMELAVSRIEKALRLNERILVWGDFDVDGQTSTSLLVSALDELGGRVDYHIPVRERESHGIEPVVLRTYIDQGLDLLLTCDTGIASVEAASLARDSGVDVIITDHHDLPEELPNALALINPKFSDPDSPLISLPGVGVAYKVIESLYERLGRADELEKFLDLVALGVVADLAMVRGDTRYLLQRGMEVLRQTSRPGLLALMKNARLDPSHVSDEQIGFQLGPRLNAVGRLADANVSVPLLTTSDEGEAGVIAGQLEQLNEERKFEMSVVYESALEQIDRQPSILQYAMLVLANPHWHQGVVGIVASRLVEEFGKPTILFALPPGELARGSARSIEGYHITQAIGTQAAILSGFGGHPMAAGLSMDPQNIDAFRRGVSKAVVEQRQGEIPEPTLDIEVELPLGELTLATARQLEKLAPFGPGNPSVNVLCRNLRIHREEQIGKDGTHRKLHVSDPQGHDREILWWNGAGVPLPEGPIDAVVRVRVGFFRGQQSLMATLQDFVSAGQSQVITNGGIEERVQLTDCRGEEPAAAKLAEILQHEPEAQVWGEGLKPDDNGTVPTKLLPRGELEIATTLVVWTLPPEQSVLSAAIARVQPKQLYLFGVDPNLDSYEAFVRRWAGLVRYAIEHYGGRSSIAALAGAMAHGERTITCALEILPGLGVCARQSGDAVELERCAVAEVEQETDALRSMLHEAGAFRRSLQKAASIEGFLPGAETA